MAEKIWVTAGDGRTVPIDPSIATAPGAHRLYLKPGDKLEVDPTAQPVFRQMRNGDLVRTEPPPPREPDAGPVTKEAELEAGGPAAAFEPPTELDDKQPRIA